MHDESVEMSFVHGAVGEQLLPNRSFELLGIIIQICRGQFLHLASYDTRLSQSTSATDRVLCPLSQRTINDCCLGLIGLP